MKKKTMMASAVALGLTLSVAAPVCANSTSMDVGGCRIGCTSSINAAYGVGTTANGNASVTVTVKSTLKSKKGSKYTTISKEDGAIGTISVKVVAPDGYSATNISSYHTAKSGQDSGHRNTSASR